MSKDQDSDRMAEQALNHYSQQTNDKPVVLIADDSRVVRVSLRKILSTECQLIEVEDGEQAWRQLCENPSINLVFSDLSMPNLDGRSLLTKIRTSESDHLARLPFIVVTGNEATHEIISELEKLGASGMIHKPFDAKLIKQFVNELANNPQEALADELHESELQTDFLENTTNKAQFMEIASRELSFAIRNKNELALALVKVDQFNSILQHYSESAVEHILLTLREIIRQHAHPDDTIAYFGDGCFSILRPASNAIGTRYLGRRILDDLTAKQFYLGESDKSISVSIGISAPDIKPGTRLQGLLILAEGRLKAALDSGGGKVVDKGNENLTPVLTQESSELSNIISNTQTSSPHTSNDAIEINRLAAEKLAEIKAKYSNQSKDHEAQASQISEYQHTLEDLTAENRALIEDVKHWKTVSSETEHLRRQLFEVESQFQQLNVKLTEVQKLNSELTHRNETIERQNRQLLGEEDERTASLRQSQQIMEGENQRLESQITELTSRAERAELESLKSNQLVSSLRENGQLLRMQLDQLQQQINELRKQRSQDSKTDGKEPTSSLVEKSSELKSDTELLDELYKPELILSATPEIKKPAKTQAKASIDPLPAKDQISLKKRTESNIKIPPFHVESEPMFFKDGFNLSAFAIASLIFMVLVLIGAIYLYVAMSETPTSEDTTLQTETTKNASPRSEAASPTLTTPGVSRDILHNSPDTNHSVTPPAPEYLNPDIPDKSQTTISNELRLEKELTLRQIAEEEFNRSIEHRSVTGVQIDSQLPAALYFEQPQETKIQPRQMNE
jgi:two-component system, cell cycle response regulator